MLRQAGLYQERLTARVAQAGDQAHLVHEIARGDFALHLTARRKIGEWGHKAFARLDFPVAAESGTGRAILVAH